MQAEACDFASTDVCEVVKGADLVILATPVGFMRALTESFVGVLSPDTIVTDVGSVKGSVVAELEPLVAAAGAVFIGSHPMAGSEKTGFDAARADLFDGATCILTPTDPSNTVATAKLDGFWASLGCNVLQMSPAEHDRKVARISHLPHAVAAAVVRAALADDLSAALCTGNGFRDSTRVAAGDPELWTGIFKDNQAEVLAALRAAQSELTDLVEIIQRMDEEALRRYLASAQALRQQVPAAC